MGEPAAPLPPEAAGIALFGAETREAAANPQRGRAIFAAKEAVYKAIDPLDGSAPEYEDIAVDLAGGRAKLRDGRTLLIEASAGELFVVVGLLGACSIALAGARETWSSS